MDSECQGVKKNGKKRKAPYPRTPSPHAMPAAARNGKTISDSTLAHAAMQLLSSSSEAKHMAAPPIAAASAGLAASGASEPVADGCAAVATANGGDGSAQNGSSAVAKGQPLGGAGVYQSADALTEDRGAKSADQNMAELPASEPAPTDAAIVETLPAETAIDDEAAPATGAVEAAEEQQHEDDDADVDMNEAADHEDDDGADEEEQEGAEEDAGGAELPGRTQYMRKVHINCGCLCEIMTLENSLDIAKQVDSMCLHCFDVKDGLVDVERIGGPQQDCWSSPEAQVHSAEAVG